MRDRCLEGKGAVAVDEVDAEGVRHVGRVSESWHPALSDHQGCRFNEAALRKNASLLGTAITDASLLS